MDRVLTEREPAPMVGLNQNQARTIILMVAGVYIVLLGMVEGAHLWGMLDRIAASEVLQQLTTLGSLTVGAVIGFHIASRHHES